jgi:serine/threonine protein phosphatase PrpC
LLERNTPACQIAAATDTGRRRKSNQDRYLIDEILGLVVLADGMGGHNSGELAAQLATERVAAFITENVDGSTTPHFDHLREALLEANASIFSRAAEEDHKGMGTTAIAALIRDNRLTAGHVGDSRLYCFRAGELEQLTRDHSMLQDLIDKGFYTERDSRSTEIGHIVTRSLGTQATVEIDCVECTLQEGDVLLFCSDGLSDLVDDWLIIDTLNECCGDLSLTCKKLITHANRNGGSDNITVVLARYGS